MTSHLRRAAPAGPPPIAALRLENFSNSNHNSNMNNNDNNEIKEPEVIGITTEGEPLYDSKSQPNCIWY